MERCTVVAKRSLQYLVPFGTATWMWGTVFIDRGANSAKSVLNKQTDAIKNQKVSFFVLLLGMQHITVLFMVIVVLSFVLSNPVSVLTTAQSEHC